MKSCEQYISKLYELGPWNRMSLFGIISRSPNWKKSWLILSELYPFPTLAFASTIICFIRFGFSICACLVLSISSSSLCLGRAAVCTIVALAGLFSYFFIFQSYRDGVIDQCSLLESRIIEISRHRHMLWYSIQSWILTTGWSVLALLS